VITDIRTDAREAEKARILVVEDEESITEALVLGLEREGFDVIVATDGIAAIDAFETHEPDLILLDVLLPKMSGVDVCKAIRAHSNVPIIMVSAKSTEIDTVVGLEVGADDYVPKPYRLRELISRIRAVMRRSARSEPVAVRNEEARTPAPEPRVLETGRIHLDRERHECIVRGEEVRLTRKEFDLLALLLENAGRLVTRDTLIDRVWGADYVGDTKTLDVHIKRLRAHVEEDPSQPVLITTIRGLGYRFESPKA
jgi:two-component system response regulator RegX3